MNLTHLPSTGFPAGLTSWRRRFLFLLLFNGLLLLWLLCRPSPHPLVAKVDNIASFLGPIIAACWCFWDFAQSRHAASAKRTGRWTGLLLGMGGFSYGIGQAIWSYYEIALHQDCPFPSWADAGFLCAYPFLLLGILTLPLHPLPNALRGRVILDGLMVIAALVTFSWYFLLGPTIQQGAQTSLGKILGPAYPFCDIILLFCILNISDHLEENRFRPVLGLLAAGLVSIVAIDTIFAYETLHGTYHTGGLADIGWPLGYMLVALAGCHLQGMPNSSREDGEDAGMPLSLPKHSPVLWRSYMPYLLFPTVGLLLLHTVHQTGDEKYEKGVYIGAAVLVCLILIRQVFALLENNHLTQFLREAYTELEAKNNAMQTLNDELHSVKTALEVKNHSLSAANERLADLALTDGLTGVRNHRAFQERLWEECERSTRYGQSLSVLMLDVDHFKRYNDTYGHLAGDEVLKTVARLLGETARDSDFVARYGGEEFVIILPYMDGDSACAAAERFRHALENAPWPKQPVTASFGLATLSEMVFIPADLLVQADQALYQSKSRGRNCVTHFAQI